MISRCGFGNSTDKSIPAINLPGYPAQVLQNGAVIAPYSVPRHDRFSRWLHEITADKFIRTPQDCVDLGLMFPYGTPGTKQPPAPTNTYPGPMSNAGIQTSMGNVAERPDIGLLPEWEAYWMRTGIAGPMLAAAKGFDSMPIWIIDEGTGRLWDLLARPNATMFYRASGPDFIASADPTVAPFPQWSMDMAHGPAIYCAYLATGGLRHLERLQAFTNWGFLETNYYVPIMGFPICSIAQMRKFAWHLRLLFMAYQATLLAERDYPNGLPVPLLPSIYWKKHLDNQRTFITQKWIGDPALQTFKYFPDVTSYRPWQFDYLLPTLLFGALLLPQEWGPSALWAMDNPIQRLNGKSGHPPAYVGAYEYLTGPNMPEGGDPNNFPFSYKPADFYPTWKAAFDAHAAAIIAAGSGWNMTATQMKALQNDPLGGGDFISWDPYPTHSLRHLMAAADYLDSRKVLAIRQTYPDFDLCLSRVTSMDLRWEAKDPGNIIPSRVSIVSGTIPAQPVQPPITQPPTGEPPMSTPLEALDTIVATLKADVAAEIKAVHDRISAIVAAAQGGTVIDPAELQAQVDALNALHQTLTADTAALPTATS
jgi:hypothetical protein